MTELRKSNAQPHRKIAVNGNAAFLLEFCECGKHPRIMAARTLITAWSQRKPVKR